MIYTYTRKIVSLHGNEIVKVKVLGCKDHQKKFIAIQDTTDLPLIPKCRADLNVTILIGFLRWRLGFKRSEVQLFLQTKGIYMSKGAISYRSLDFLLLFKELHRARTSKIKAFFNRKGGSILHIDGTHRSGRRVVFVLQEGYDDMIIDSNLIPSEASEHIDPFLLEFKDSYGHPLVIVRDMGKGVASSSSNVFPGIPQQVCQPHFIRDLEKDLVTQYHKGLKSSIVKHKLSSRLKKLRATENIDNPMKGLQQRWIHIAVDYLFYPIEKQIKWMSKPIAYHLQYNRITEVSCLVRRLVLWNASNNCFYKPLMELDTCLESVLGDKTVTRRYHLIKKTLEWLDVLREQLQISRDGHLKDIPSNEIDIETVKEEIKAILKNIRKEAQELGGKYEKIASEIEKAFDTHWNELFVPDPIVNGKRISFRRHNNGLESSHRRTRKSIRERTGRSETNREMEQFGDLLAILSNIWNKAYQDEILYDVPDLAYALGQYVSDLPRLRQKYRDVRKGPTIPIKDEKRLGVLDEFIHVLESITFQDELLSTLQSIVMTEA